MGRKTKLNDERADRIAQLIRAGNYSAVAAQSAGVSARTFWRWLSQAESIVPECEAWEEAEAKWNDLAPEDQALRAELQPKESEKPSDKDLMLYRFYKKVKEAEAEAEAAAVLQVRQAANNGVWQAAAWFLERKHKDRWSRSDKVEIDGQVHHQHGLAASEEELEAARKRLEKARSKALEPAINAEVIDETSS